MTFSDGEQVEDEFCPKCNTPLFYEMSFQDIWSDRSGHYTVDVPLKVCKKCDYNEVIEESDEE